MKYNLTFTVDSINREIGRLTNQLWKLIPMRENQEDWLLQLDTVLLEISGLSILFEDLKENTFIQLLAKLEGLHLETLSFEVYRKTVFESITLLQELKQYG